jgi:hypothetical protein
VGRQFTVSSPLKRKPVGPHSNALGPDDQGEYGEKLNNLTKFVASSKLDDASWGDFPAAAVTRARPTGIGEPDAWVMASEVIERGADFLREEVTIRPAPPLSLAQGDFLPKNLLIHDEAIVGVDLGRWEVSAGAPCTIAQTWCTASTRTGLRAAHKVGRVERRHSCILPFAGGRLTGTPSDVRSAEPGTVRNRTLNRHTR